MPQVITHVHEYCDFFAKTASTPFDVPAPSTLREHGTHPARASMSRLQFLHRILILRAASLLAAATRSLNDSRLLEFAFAGRGLLETAAAAAYHSPLLAISADTIALPDDYDARLRAAVMGSRFDWREFSKDPATRSTFIERYDGAEDLQTLWPETAAVNVLTMLEALARWLQATGMEQARGVVFFNYSLLSDICHPALGSYILYLGEIEPRLRADLTPTRDTVLGLAAELLPCVAYSALSIIGILAELEIVEEQLERLANPAPPSSPAAEAQEGPARSG